MQATYIYVYAFSKIKIFHMLLSIFLCAVTNFLKLNIKCQVTGGWHFFDQSLLHIRNVIKCEIDWLLYIFMYLELEAEEFCYVKLHRLFSI